MTMPSPASPYAGFKAENPEGYEGIMGRWSRRLAPLLIGLGGLADGERVLDVGCGTGSLTFALPQAAKVAEVVGIDPSEAYVGFAAARNTDPRLSFRTGDARALPFADAMFDRAYSMLVLQFIPEYRQALDEMIRVTKPGGTITSAVWDSFSGLSAYRMLRDIAGVLDPTARFPFASFSPLTGQGDIAAAWRAAGLQDVVASDLMFRMDYAGFDDYWAPLEAGDGPPGQYIMSLTPDARATLKDHVRRAYVSNRPDGVRSFVAVALGCRGTKPG